MTTTRTRVTDFADGFNLDGVAGNDDDANADEMFVPLELNLPAPIDLAKAKIRLTYDASDPAGATAVPVPLDPPTVTIPDYQKATGHLRIWTVRATGRSSADSVKSGWQFVAPDTYTPSELGFGGGRVATLYVEAVAESASAGDQRILVEVDPDGSSGARDFILEDAVRVTSVILDIQDLAKVGNQRIEGGDMAFIAAEPSPQMPRLTAEVSPDDIPGQFACRLEFEFDRSAAVLSNGSPLQAGANCPGGPDQVMLPQGFPSQVLSAGQRWHLEFEYYSLYPDSDFFGGDGYIACDSPWGEELKHEFRIRGQNPSDAVARAYIDATHTFRFAYAIAKHETKEGSELYNQFNINRNKYIGDERLYVPVSGPPDGWGLFQLDLSSNPAACSPSSVLWNWKRDVKGAIPVLANSLSKADAWLNSESPRKDGPAGTTGNCVLRMGDPFPHGQRPQSRIDLYLATHPSLSLANVYSTNPSPCVSTSTGLMGSVLPAPKRINDRVEQNCTFTEGALTSPGYATFEEAGAIQCFNGCSPHYVVWNGVDWEFKQNVNRYVEKVCLQVEP